MSKLALFGGEPLCKPDFWPSHPIMDAEEKAAVAEVLKSGRLSSFIAAKGDKFLGGLKVREFEQAFIDKYKCKHAVAFNSATAALHAAVVACAEPSTEVITTPYTFTSSASCALMHNAIPVFADIDPDTYCINPEAIEATITPLTRAIIPVHLFGRCADMAEIMRIARKYNLRVIEDCAQSPNTLYIGQWNEVIPPPAQFAGTIGDCGIFSFTENKNIATGEGGMLITNDDHIAEVARLVRNHGEACVDGQARSYTSSLVGWNYRMTEIQAAIGIEQFKKLDFLNSWRECLANSLSAQLSKFDFLELPGPLLRGAHAYYIYAMKFDAQKAGISRANFISAMVHEGIPFGAGYIKPLYLSPLYQRRNHFAYRHYTGNVSYESGLCPVAEDMHFNKLIMTLLLRFPASIYNTGYIEMAIQKIIENKEEFSK